MTTVRVTCRFCQYSFDAPKDSFWANNNMCTFCSGMPTKHMINVDADSLTLIRCLAYFFNKLKESITAPTEEETKEIQNDSPTTLISPQTSLQTVSQVHSNDGPGRPSARNVAIDPSLDPTGVDSIQGQTAVDRHLQKSEPSPDTKQPTPAPSSTDGPNFADIFRRLNRTE